MFRPVRRAPQVVFDPEREEAELRAYLGTSYDRGLLERWQQTLEREFEACEDEQRFYRSSEAYLYNLTAFAMTGTKTPYLEEFLRCVPPRSRVLDYGCGIGSDGLALLEAGYKVEFADFDNPSTRYLRWRLGRRGLEAPIHDLDREVPGGYDAAYALDVIEHVSDPFAFLGELESRSRLVMVNLLEPGPDEEVLHRELPVRELVDHAATRRLISYRVHHGRSHLVLYSPERARPMGRLMARAQVMATRVRRRARRER